MAEREALISPSLLASVPIRKVPKRFTIGMSDWTDGSDVMTRKKTTIFDYRGVSAQSMGNSDQKSSALVT